MVSKNRVNLKNVFLGMVLVLLLSACGVKETTPVSLKLYWRHGTDFVGFYAALGSGFYEEEGLDVTIDELSDPTLGREIPRQVEEGEYDFAIGGYDLQLAQNEGKPLTVFANFYKFAPGAFFARTDTGIQTPADLKGMRISIKNQTWQDILVSLLEQVDLTLDDIILVETGYDMAPFFDGEVDVWGGFLTNEAVLARMAGLDIVTLPLYEYGSRGTSVNLFTSHAVLENPELVERFLRASIRGWRWAIDNPQEAADMMLEMYPELDEDPEFYLVSFEASIPLLIPGGFELGAIDCDLWMENESFVDVSSPEGICTTEIFEKATK